MVEESTLVESASTRTGMLGPLAPAGVTSTTWARLSATHRAASAFTSAGGSARTSTRSERASFRTASRAAAGTGPHTATLARVRSSSPRLSLVTEPSRVKSAG